jgi:hypothetical protein
MRPTHLILSQLRTVWSDLLGGGVCLLALLCLAGSALAAAAAPPDGVDGEMTEAEAMRLGEEFGVVVGPVDEEIQKILKLVRPEGVVVFEVIGGTRADLAGIKVKAVIKEIDKVDVKNLIDFGKALKRAMQQCDFTVATYEPADPGDPVGWGVNFHFVGCKRD